MTLSKGDNPDIYVMDLASKHLTQITNQFSIDTEATWSPDGAWPILHLRSRWSPAGVSSVGQRWQRLSGDL